MSNSYLLSAGALFTIAHGVAIYMCPRVNPFYVIVLTNGCLTSLMSDTVNRTLITHYDRIVIIASFIIDLYFMKQTNTTHCARKFELSAIYFYLTSKLCIHFHKFREIDPFSGLLRILAYLAITISHLIIIFSF